MILLLFVALAAFFNSVMDALENENYFESIFKAWSQKFWYKRESWKFAKRLLSYKVDGWHLSKSIMIAIIMTGCWLQALVFKKAIVQTGQLWVDVLLSVIISGIAWNVVFRIFYHKIFRVK